MVVNNRSISLILMLTEFDGSSTSNEPLNLNICLSPDNLPPASLPIYQGTIVRIEENPEKENSSDLIIRIPNFQHFLSSKEIEENENKKIVRVKRRAPMCPTLSISAMKSGSCEEETNENRAKTNVRLNHRQRFAAGLRHFSRVLATSYKTKPSANLDRITFVPMLPDVEVMPEPLGQEKSIHVPTSKMISPKVFCIKKRNFKIKRRRSPSTSAEGQIVPKSNKNSEIKEQLERKNITFKDHVNVEYENQLKDSNEIESMGKEPMCQDQRSTTIIDQESTSADRYCSIPGTLSDPSIFLEENQPPAMTVIDINRQSNEITSSTSLTVIQSSTEEQLEPLLITNPPMVFDELDEETYSECYEITYEFDSEFQYQSNLEQDSSVNINPEKHDENFIGYETLASTFSSWSPMLPSIRQSSNLEEKIHLENTNNPQMQIESIQTDVNDDSLQSLTVLSMDNQDDDVFIDEDYTVIVEFMKQVLKMNNIHHSPTIDEEIKDQ